MAVRVAVAGATGKLGSLVCKLVAESSELELSGAVVSADGGNIGKIIEGVEAVGPDRLLEVAEDCDVYVDLTSPDAAARSLGRVSETGARMVIGTTAVPAEVLETVAAGIKKNSSSAVVSANFAIGVNVFWKMCEILAHYLPDYDIEVIEAHHNMKKDAPSGTAAEAVKRLQEATGIENVVHGRNGVVGARGREIGVHSIRAGDIIGDHTVIFAGNMERMELTHRAISRETFARGCLQTIEWVADKNDGKMHSMKDVLGL